MEDTWHYPKWVVNPIRAMFNLVPITSDFDICNLLFYAIKFDDFTALDNLPDPSRIIRSQDEVHDQATKGHDSLSRCCISDLIRNKNFAVLDDVYGSSSGLVGALPSTMNHTGQCGSDYQHHRYNINQQQHRIVHGISMFQYLQYYHYGSIQKQRDFIQILQEYLLKHSQYAHTSRISQIIQPKQICGDHHETKTDRDYQTSTSCHPCTVCSCSSNDYYQSNTQIDGYQPLIFPYLDHYYGDAKPGGVQEESITTPQMNRMSHDRVDETHNEQQKTTPANSMITQRLLAHVLSILEGIVNPMDLMQLNTGEYTRDIQLFRPLYGYIHAWEASQSQTKSSSIQNQETRRDASGEVVKYQSQSDHTSIDEDDRLDVSYLFGLPSAAHHQSKMQDDKKLMRQHDMDDYKHLYERLLCAISCSDFLEIEALLLVGVNVNSYPSIPKTTSTFFALTDEENMSPAYDLFDTAWQIDRMVDGIKTHRYWWFNNIALHDSKNNSLMQVKTIGHHEPPHQISPPLPQSNHGGPLIGESNALHLINTTDPSRFEKMLQLLLYYGGDVLALDWYERNLIQRLFLRSIRSIEIVKCILHEFQTAIERRLQEIQLITKMGSTVYQMQNITSLTWHYLRNMMNKYDSSGFHILHYIGRKTYSSHTKDVLFYLLHHFRLDPTCQVKRVGYSRCVDGFTVLHFLSAGDANSDLVEIILDCYLDQLLRQEIDDDAS